MMINLKFLPMGISGFCVFHWLDKWVCSRFVAIGVFFCNLLSCMDGGWWLEFSANLI